MALIKCHECGKEFSDKASACPHCGAPFEKFKYEHMEESKKKKTNWATIILVIFVLYIIGLISESNNSTSAIEQAPAVEAEPKIVEIASVALYKKGFPVCISELLLDNWTNGDISSRIPMLNKYCYIVDFDREVSSVKSHGNNKVSFEYLDKGEFYGYEDGIQK